VNLIINSHAGSNASLIAQKIPDGLHKERQQRLFRINFYPSKQVFDSRVPLNWCDEYFLNDSFWNFSQECAISNPNLQFGFENEGHFQKHFFP
jgi:hypothetical protein